MKILRTPNARFEALPDYPFVPHYAELAGGLRLHYLDEGPRDGPVVLMMHGEPSWSYLYRHMIPRVAAARCRVIAPDLIGFGRSDKPSETSDYTYARHVAWMREWFEAMALDDVALMCQDWGGLIGLRLVAAYPERFAGVVAANTILPVGKGEMSDAIERLGLTLDWERKAWGTHKRWLQWLTYLHPVDVARLRPEAIKSLEPYRIPCRGPGVLWRFGDLPGTQETNWVIREARDILNKDTYLFADPDMPIEGYDTKYILPYTEMGWME